MASTHLTITEPTLYKVKVIVLLALGCGCAAVLTLPFNHYGKEPTKTAASELFATTIGNAGGTRVMWPRMIPGAALLRKTPSMSFGRPLQPYRVTVQASPFHDYESQKIGDDKARARRKYEKENSLATVVNSVTAESAPTLREEFEGLRTFEGDKGLHVLHKYVVAYRANQRFGNANTKTRSEVRGGGRKPYQQKKTGRARRGSNRSPLIRGGGVIFGPKPRDYSQKLPKKEKRCAFERVLFERANDGTMEVIDSIPAMEGKTKEFAAWFEKAMSESQFPLEKLPAKPSYLIVDETFTPEVLRASSNLNFVHLRMPVKSEALPGQRSPRQVFPLNAYDVLHAHKIFITKEGLKGIIKRNGRCEEEDEDEVDEAAPVEATAGE